MRDITLCHPRLQRLAGAWMKACVTQGIAVTIGETFRTVAEQDALYAQGRTKPGKKVTNAPGSSYSSQHQWGIAFDFYLIMDIDGDGSTSDDAFNKVNFVGFLLGEDYCRRILFLTIYLGGSLC